MTLDEFVAGYTNMRPDADGVYGVQCVDLIKIYCIKVLGVPMIKGNAVDYIKNPQPENFEYHKNTPFYIPKKGMIAIWDENVGDGLGHVAIVLSAGLMRFTSLDLNWPKGEKVITVKHTYIFVAGFLNRKNKEYYSIANELLEEITRVEAKYRKMLNGVQYNEYH
jgi:hypothetical protein